MAKQYWPANAREIVSEYRRQKSPHQNSLAQPRKLAIDAIPEDGFEAVYGVRCTEAKRRVQLKTDVHRSRWPNSRGFATPISRVRPEAIRQL